MARMINAKCHGCATPMVFEAVPVTITEWTGEVITFWGKDDAVWICKTCHDDPKKLKAARKATQYLPEVAEISHYDDENEDSQSGYEFGARAISSSSEGCLLALDSRLERAE